MPGPPPADPRFRLIRGSRAPKAPAAGPSVAVLAPAVPDELAENVEASREWVRTIVPAIEAGLITAADRAMAIAHCDLWATWRSQLREASEAPHVVHVGPNAHPVPNPIRGMANTTAKLLRSVDAQLGLTPTTRSRVAAAPRTKAPSAVEQFMEKKKPRRT